MAEAHGGGGPGADDLAALAAEIERLEAETADLAAGETVPTRAMVEAARLARDRTWRGCCGTGRRVPARRRGIRGAARYRRPARRPPCG